ncbi:hypothetical protein Tco_1571858, partial [Tanacetum coccineum]
APVQDEPDLPEGSVIESYDIIFNLLEYNETKGISRHLAVKRSIRRRLVQPSSSRTWHARIQTDDYAGRRNTSVGLFGKLQRVMHCEKEKGLSKSPNEGRKPELHILSWECIASLMNANP